MSVRDYEHKLKIEIGENEHRKEFTFSERMAWARELERVESAKARERMSEGGKGRQNSVNLRTDDKVSNDIGLGSRDTYRKAKFIAENAEPETINQLDNEEISIHKAFTELKAKLKEKDKLLHLETEKRKRAEQETFAARKSEQLTRKQYEELEQQEPQIIEREAVKEVQVESYKHINIINELKDENAELKDTADFYKQKADALLKNPEDLREEESSLNYLANTNVHTIIAYIDSFIQDVSISALMRGSIANANDITKENLRQRTQMLRELTNDLEISMTGREIN
ncbi:chromosome partitioning protein ParB [Bacillus cereus]